jgi:superkiller protein 3
LGGGFQYFKIDDLWCKKGRVLTQLDRYDEALEAYERSIEITPDNREAWLEKAEVLEKLGKGENAQQARKKAKELC